jgi:DNA-binding IclR family transcriptional regulator
MQTIAPHLRSVVDHDGAVILDIEHDTMLTLNSTGGYIWQRLQQGKLIDEIVSELARDTGADLAAVDRDVHVFLEQLRSKRLLRDAEREPQQAVLHHSVIR